MTDLLEFRAGAKRFLASRNIYDEDLLSEMVLYTLERGEKRTNMRYVMLNAYKKLYRRVVIAGETFYEKNLTCHLSDKVDVLADKTPSTPEQALLAEASSASTLFAENLPRKAYLRLMVLSRLIQHRTGQELGDVFDLHRSRTFPLPNLLGRSKDQQPPLDNFAVRIAWIQL